MDRMVSQDGMDFQVGTVGVDLMFTAGTSGAVPSSLTLADGITSVVLANTFEYTVTFDDAYVAFLGGYGSIIPASYSKARAVGLLITATNDSASGNPLTVTITPIDGDGDKIVLTASDVVRFHFRCQRQATV